MKILGENNIDLTLFSEPENFGLYLPGAAAILGKPTYTLYDKILWRIIKTAIKSTPIWAANSTKTSKPAYLSSKTLENDQSLLQEYISLKEEQGLSARTYYRKKNEFYNRVLGLR